MGRASKLEVEAIKSITNKVTRDRIKNLGLPETFILSLYHNSGRHKNFEEELNKTLDELSIILKEVQKAITLSKTRIRKFEKIKKGIINDTLKKRYEYD